MRQQLLPFTSLSLTLTLLPTPRRIFCATALPPLIHHHKPPAIFLNKQACWLLLLDRESHAEATPWSRAPSPGRHPEDPDASSMSWTEWGSVSLITADIRAFISISTPSKTGSSAAEHVKWEATNEFTVIPLHTAKEGLQETSTSSTVKIK